MRVARMSRGRCGRPLELPQKPDRDHRAAVRHRQPLQRVLHQLRRQREDGDCDARGRRQRACRIRRRPDVPRRAGRDLRLGQARRAKFAARHRLRRPDAARRQLPLGITGGTFVFVGDYAANNATLAPSMLASITGPLAAAASTPIGPVATAMGNAIRRTVGNFDSTGQIRMVNFPGGGAARIQSANVAGPSGARVASFRRRRRHLLLADRAPAHRRPDRDRWRRAADRPHRTTPAAQRRPDQRRRPLRSLYRQWVEVGAGPGALRRGGRRIDPAEHGGAARRAVPRRPRPGAAPADQRPHRARRRLRHRHAAAPWSVLPTSRRARCSSGRPACRSARWARRSSPSGPAERCRSVHGSAGRCSTAGLASRRCGWPRRVVRSRASGSR